MTMTIIQSIHLCLAAGNGCEVWHPGKGIYSVKMMGEGHPISGYPECKIVRKPFSALVAEVQADPVDNAAVRAFHSGACRWSAGLDGYGLIEVAADASPQYKINQYWGIHGHEGYGVGVHYHLSLISEGFPAGIPREHWISREEVERVENG